MIRKALTPELLERLRLETELLPNKLSPDYSAAQAGPGDMSQQLVDGALGTALTGLPANPPTAEFLERLFGETPLFRAF